MYRRLGVVRLFATWLQANDSRHQIPPADLVPSRKRRPKPFIYTTAQIVRILEQAAKLPSTNGIRRLTYPTLFGLIAVTGLRISEALSLDSTDIDFDERVVVVRKGKSGEQRIIPICESTSLKLKNYARERDRLCEGKTTPFFVDDHGRRISDCAARYNFASVTEAVATPTQALSTPWSRAADTRLASYIRSPDHDWLVSTWAGSRQGNDQAYNDPRP